MLVSACGGLSTDVTSADEPRTGVQQGRGQSSLNGEDRFVQTVGLMAVLDPPAMAIERADDPDE